ncbi:cell division ATP-binding protein FtsE [Marinicella gelatinilytica]|uniref:cell division ATP-binding protein FtsE n=1 Tax=Marinicella gelatinilytica TaxID=2996017 RepID=UPI002260DD50|nr:cell division ATP-binding protein FtsE [Marinicella gelatinilytica]MCX7545177.1 cell division ATP-binding protein FtsE [Marinicella gelatinilytica]
MISFNRVSKSYGKHNKALADVSFEVDAGEMLFLTGHSGAGKTSILKLIMRIETMSYGQAQVNGHNLRQLSDNQLPGYRRDLGMIFQDHRLLENRTILDNVAMSMWLRGFTVKDSRKQARVILGQVGLAEKTQFYPSQLSSGQQQRVGIARAIISKPAILLADEPTGNLDPDLSLELMDLFMRINRNGTTVVIASHDLVLIKRLRKRVLVLDSGRLIDDYRPI